MSAGGDLLGAEPGPSPGRLRQAASRPARAGSCSSARPSRKVSEPHVPARPRARSDRL